MDPGLRYKNHRMIIGTEDLKAVMALEKIRSLASLLARQLFYATVIPVTNYASTIWANTLGFSADKIFRCIQKLGVQVVTGAFNSVTKRILEIEALIYSINTRKVVKLSI